MEQERYRFGIALRDDLAAPSLGSFANRFGRLDDARIDAAAAQHRLVFSITTPSIHQRAGNLSGGNQQKVLLAMWMGIKPGVLIVDEATRGIDVGARCDIYSRLRALAATGVGILMVCGRFDLSVGSTMAMTGAVAAYIHSNTQMRMNATEKTHY